MTVTHGPNGEKITTVVAHAGEPGAGAREISYKDTKVIGNGSFGVVFAVGIPFCLCFVCLQGDEEEEEEEENGVRVNEVEGMKGQQEKDNADTEGARKRRPKLNETRREEDEEKASSSLLLFFFFFFLFSASSSFSSSLLVLLCLCSFPLHHSLVPVLSFFSLFCSLCLRSAFNLAFFFFFVFFFLFCLSHTPSFCLVFAFLPFIFIY